MKIPGVFVNIDGGATRRPDEELNKETAADLCRVPSICLNPDNPSSADINEMRRSIKRLFLMFLLHKLLILCYINVLETYGLFEITLERLLLAFVG